jgi:hypothetical protein
MGSPRSYDEAPYLSRAILLQERAGVSDKEFVHFLHNARGSICELETQLAIAHRLGYLTEANLTLLTGAASEVARLLNGLITALKPAVNRVENLSFAEN